LRKRATEKRDPKQHLSLSVAVRDRSTRTEFNSVSSPRPSVRDRNFSKHFGREHANAPNASVANFGNINKFTDEALVRQVQ